MNAEQLLQHFEYIADAADAVEQLRRFILELAVRGKLVEQDDEKPYIPSKMDKTPFPIPASWHWKTVKDIGQTQTGSTPPTVERGYYDGEIPFIKPAAINDSVISYDGPGLTESGVKESTCVNPGSILMVCIGGSIGKAALVDRKVCFNQQINSLSPLEKVDSSFILFAMQSPYFQTQVWASAAQGTLPIISKGKWERLFIPLPPLSQQHRIVAKVDELMALCDELEAARAQRETRRNQLVASTLHSLANEDAIADLGPGLAERAHFYFNHLPRLTTRPDHIKQLRQTILNLAVRGKLVPQDREDEPTSELIKRVEAKRIQFLKQNKNQAPELLDSIDDDEFLFSIPPGWKVMHMGWLARKLGAGSTPLGGKSVYQSEGVPFLRSQNVHNDGLRLNDVALIPRTVHERMSGTHIQQQDILLNITGASIGRCALVPNDFIEGNVSQHVAIIRLFEPAIREFIHLSLISSSYQNLIMDVQVGVSREGLSMQNLKLFPMVIPPLAEQQRIVAKVNKLMTLCDALEAQLTNNADTRRQLLEATLYTALAGQHEAEISL